MNNVKTIISKVRNVVLRKKKQKNSYSPYIDIHHRENRFKEYLWYTFPLNQQALILIGKQGKPDDYVFKLPNSESIRKSL